MATATLIFLAVCLGCAEGPYPTGRVSSLFVGIGEQKLDEKQAKLLERIVNHPTSVNHAVVRLLVKNLDNKPNIPLRISLGHNKYLEMGRGWKVDKRDDSSLLSWRGKPDTLDMVSITFRGHTAIGLIYFDKKVYSVEPLGQGIHAIVELDQSKFKE